MYDIDILFQKKKENDRYSDSSSYLSKDVSLFHNTSNDTAQRGYRRIVTAKLSYGYIEGK